jgi:hypothetical protein
MKNVIAIFTALLFASTSMWAQNNQEFPPIWVSKLPKAKKNIVYVVGHGQSRSQSIANDKARVNAFAELANMLGPTKVTIKEQNKGEESTEGTKLTKNQVDVTLTDVSVVDQATKQNDEGLYDTYILVSYDKKKKRRK